MTQFIRAQSKGPQINQPDRAGSLFDAIKTHLAAEVVSLHMPGHKGRAIQPSGEDSRNVSPDRQLRYFDMTEVPGLDELSTAAGVLAGLEEKIAALWQADKSFISINGASAGIVAAILANAGRGKFLLVPRNAHRSVVYGLILSGLEPVWYEPVWLDDWGTWSGPEQSSFFEQLKAHADNLAAALLVSPNYAGIAADVSPFAALCHQYNIPLIVDEAHGAHFLPHSPFPPSALSQGADLVIHSLHKTLNALTQTGIIHVSKTSLTVSDAVQAARNITHTSSPSYVLMRSIEECYESLINNPALLNHFHANCLILKEELANIANVLVLDNPGHGFICDPAHIFIALEGRSGQNVAELLRQKGIYAEAALGHGVLLLAGIGTSLPDITRVKEALKNITGTSPKPFPALPKMPAPPNCPQVISPRLAYFSPTELIAVDECQERIAADTIAPCPPGIPLVHPGQRLTREVIPCLPIKHIRVISKPAYRKGGN